MNCIVIDDELASRMITEQLCSQTSNLEMTSSFDNCVDALKYLNDNEVDVIFLDLHMESFSGFDLLKTLKEDQKVVLTTSDKKFASESYDYDNIVDYLVKPVTPERFDKAVQRVRKQFVLDQISVDSNEGESQSNRVNSLYINIDRRLIHLQFDEIDYVEADGDYINVYTATENYHVHTTLKRIRERLPEPVFMQIHRSYIINFNKIIDIQDNSVLIGRKVIPISRSNRPMLMERLNLL
ncbi:LytR/AlgR family response regulator transcription factor [Croceivirga thetidis]|uniref:Response regulator transcription factor n=1 Tax=Croceivirga thetidis TaxID=2721623 RepID=A0ABX1GP34_9FLAO|nr:LytTR family DNA-binding domain-containing protein [Croceivirga thetidis]NKI30720.1 response regulator transcription factor [Croceivirga thetidis]